MKRNCGICGESKNKLIYKQKFIVPTSNYFHAGYDVVVCERCGFAYADNIPDQNFLDSYYKLMLKKTSGLKRKIRSLKKSSEQVEEDFLLTQYTHSAKNIVRFISKSAKILDVGCYTGGLLAHLKKLGYKNGQGLDMSAYASEVALKKNKVKVTVGSVFDDLNINQFNMVILTHVLEHIKDLHSFIYKLSTYLNKNGLLYIEVPDAYNFFFPKENDNRYSNDQKEPFLQFSVEHINYFSKVSLENLMKSCGFKKIFIESQTSHIAVLASVWKRNEMVKDNIIEAKLKKYVKESNQKITNITKTINELVKSRKEIMIWGAGLHTQKLLSISNLGKVNIKAFIDSDNNYLNGKLIGRPILSPEKIDSNYPILISSKRYQNEIRRQIIQTGFKNRIITLY